MKPLSALALGLCSLQLSAQQTIELGTVAIQGRSPTASVLQSEPNQIELSAQEVNDLPGTADDPLRAIDNLPGANQASGGVYLRGSSTNDNTLLIDELSVPYLYHFGDTLSLINKEILSGFDVYPSSFAARYPNRLGGVIDVQLRDPRALAVSEQRVHIGTYDAGYFVEGALSDKDSAYFSIRRSHIDLLLSGSSADDITFVQFPKFIDSVSRWQRKLDNGEITTTLIASDDDLEIDLGSDAVNEDKAAIGRLSSSQGFVTLGSQYRSDLNDDWSQDTTISLSRSHNDLKIGQQQATDPNPGQPYFFDLSATERLLKSNLYGFVNDNEEWQFGAEAGEGKVNVKGYISSPPDERDGPADTLTESDKFQLDESIRFHSWALYAHQYRQWRAGWSTEVGVRAESFRLYGQDYNAPLSPRVTVNYEWRPGLKFNASYGVYYQSPQGFELSRSLGNPQLDYQRAEHQTLGLQYQWNSDWSAQLAWYRKPMSHLVVETETAERYNNNGIGEARGIDVFIKRRPEGNRQDWLGYTYADSTRTNNNTGLSRPFDGDQQQTLKWVHQRPMSASWSAWKWGWKLKMHSGAPFTPVVGREAKSLQPGVDCLADGDAANCYWSPIYADQNSDRLPAYFSVDLAMSKRVQQGNQNHEYKLELLNASELFYSNVGGYDYGDDFEHIDKPKKISSSFGVLPAASATFYF